MAGRKYAKPEAVEEAVYNGIEPVEDVGTDVANAAAEVAEDSGLTAYEGDPIDHSTVTIPVGTAVKIVDLFVKLKEADGHFKSCQSTNFREYVRSVLNAPKISDAFERLKADIGK